jgi:hypothetical protein
MFHVPDVTSPHFSGNLTFTTNDPKWPTLHLPVVAFVHGKAVPKQHSLFFGRITRDVAVVRECEVDFQDSISEQQIELAEFECDHKEVSCVFQKAVGSAPGNRYLLATTFRADNATANGLFKGVVIARLGSSVLFAVPYSAIVQSDQVTP